MSEQTPFPTPAFESPITSPNPAAATGGATVTDMSDVTKLVVKRTPARSGGLGPTFGRSELIGEALVCGSRPDEWMVFGTAESVAPVASSVGDAHIVDLTHGRTLLRLAGPAAAAALEKVCGLDWSDAMMPDGAVTSASVAKVSCDVVRNDRDGQQGYLIAADRSFGQYLYDALIDAADEFR